MRGQTKTTEGAIRPSVFGLLMPMVGSHVGAAQLMAELVEEAQAAERAGLDLVVVPEHHQGPDGSLTDPIVTTSWLLAKTERIRVGPGVLLAPLHHVVRLAEQSAILHEASGGRLFLGIGAGYQPADFELFGRDLKSRKDDLRALIEGLRDAWNGGVPSAGPAVVPRMTRPAPEIWMGSWSPWGVRTAARLADGWLADPIRSQQELRDMSGRYRAAIARAGREARIHIMKHCWVGQTDAAARITYARVVEPVYRYYLREGALGADAGLDAADLVLGGALEDRVICGSPGTVADRLTASMLEVGADGCTLALRHPSGPSHRDVLEAIDLLGNEVLPQVRRRLRESGS